MNINIYIYIYIYIARPRLTKRTGFGGGCVLGFEKQHMLRHILTSNTLNIHMLYIKLKHRHMLQMKYRHVLNCILTSNKLIVYTHI